MSAASASLATLAPVLDAMTGSRAVSHPAYPTRAALRAESARDGLVGHDFAVAVQVRAILARARAEIAALPEYELRRMSLDDVLGTLDDIAPVADDKALTRQLEDYAADEIANGEAA